jgi:hypothetical protein
MSPRFHNSAAGPQSSWRPAQPEGRRRHIHGALQPMAAARRQGPLERFFRTRPYLFHALLTGALTLAALAFVLLPLIRRTA